MRNKAHIAILGDLSTFIVRDNVSVIFTKEPRSCDRPFLSCAYMQRHSSDSVDCGYYTTFIEVIDTNIVVKSDATYHIPLANPNYKTEVLKALKICLKGKEQYYGAKR